MKPKEALKLLSKTFMDNCTPLVYEIDYSNHKIVIHKLYGIMRRPVMDPIYNISTGFVDYAVIEGDSEICLDSLFSSKEDAIEEHNKYIEEEKRKLESKKIL